MGHRHALGTLVKRVQDTSEFLTDQVGVAMEIFLDSLVFEDDLVDNTHQVVRVVTIEVDIDDQGHRGSQMIEISL